ncbi:hypothetical protein [Nonomuraea sp. NPDC050643]|uniref:hypothetical protein n=1 Tax=Nonomuraea sp. NPDC050643 TaxID=3155660 RepID=UPI0033FC0CF3
MADRYRWQPHEVEAIRWMGEDNCAEVFAFAGLNHDDWADETDHSVLHFESGDGGHATARHGDWLVKGGDGHVFVWDDPSFRSRVEPLPEPAGPEANYHDSVNHLRGDLMKGSARWEKVVDEYAGRSGKAETTAFAAALMAGSYSYTLSAIIGYARKYGAHVAHDLAFEADEILMNGDFEAMNADVIASSADSLPLPEGVTVDATQGSHGEPGAHWRCAEHRHSGTWTDHEDNALAARADAIAHLDRLHDGWRTAHEHVEQAP